MDTNTVSYHSEVGRVWGNISSRAVQGEEPRKNRETTNKKFSRKLIFPSWTHTLYCEAFLLLCHLPGSVTHTLSAMHDGLEQLAVRGEACVWILVTYSRIDRGISGLSLSSHSIEEPAHTLVTYSSKQHHSHFLLLHFIYSLAGVRYFRSRLPAMSEKVVSPASLRDYREGGYQNHR